MNTGDRSGKRLLQPRVHGISMSDAYNVLAVPVLASRRLPMSRFVTFAALLATGFAAAAYAAPQSAPAPNPSNPQVAAPAATQGHPSPIKPGDRNCLRETGSMIPPKKGGCLPVFGRTYTKDEIDNTGAHTLGPALQRLDPSLTVSGGGN